MKYRVLMVREAEEDIFDIYRYVLSTDGRGRATYVLGRLQKACQSLANMPRRGHRPPELERIGYGTIWRFTLSLIESYISSLARQSLFIASWMAAGPCRRCWNVVCSVDRGCV